jgi:hypothetical protein
VKVIISFSNLLPALEKQGEGREMQDYSKVGDGLVGCEPKFV